MRQTTFATLGFDRYAKTTRKAAFLAEICGSAWKKDPRIASSKMLPKIVRR
jgi:hypothetical protein